MLTYISINSLSREVSFHNMLKMKLCWLDKKVYLILILTFILRGSYSVFGFTVMSFPLNRCACLTISVYILWTEGDEIMK